MGRDDERETINLERRSAAASAARGSKQDAALKMLQAELSEVWGELSNAREKSRSQAERIILLEESVQVLMKPSCSSASALPTPKAAAAAAAAAASDAIGAGSVSNAQAPLASAAAADLKGTAPAAAAKKSSQSRPSSKRKSSVREHLEQSTG